jgi:hypothetical protein
MTESEREARERKVWKQEKPACTCTPVNPRHREGYKCITKDQLAAWWRATSRPGRVVVSDWAKRMAWLWLQFDQDPEAKRLSGRQDLGGDRWDDAAGMTEMQKEMFR